MKFKIAGKEYELKFGMKFVRQLDILYKVDYQGLELGAGLSMAYMGLAQYSPSVISDIIKAAVAHEENVKLKTIDESVEEYAEENGDLGELFEDLKEEMGKSPVVKFTLNKMNQVTEQQMQAQGLI